MELKDILEMASSKKTLFYQVNHMVKSGAEIPLTLRCPMTFTNFPFDTQRCDIEWRLEGNITPKLHDVKFIDTNTLGYHIETDILGYNMQVCLSSRS